MTKLMQPDALESADDDDMVEPKGPTFKIFSGVLKAFEKDVNGETRKFLRCTASSTVKDLHGDYMTDDCVMDMAPQAKAKGMTIFLNHSYKWPEDVFGKTTDATIINRDHDANGAPIYDLDLEIQLNESNERAINSYAAIKEQGIKAGVSIGAMIEDWDYIDEDAGFYGGLQIKKLDLLEASVVGIPANQRSWVINGIEALGAPREIIRKAAGLPEKRKGAPVTAPAKLMQVDHKYVLDGKDVSKDLIIETTTKELDPDDETKVLSEEIEVSGPTTDVEDSAAPEGETPDEAEDTSTDADDEAAEKSSPTPDAVVAQLKDAGVGESLLEIVLGFLEGATEEVASLRDANHVLEESNASLTRQLEEAAEIVETIARTPLGRKAQFEGPVTTFREKFGGIYDEESLRLLDQGAQR